MSANSATLAKSLHTVSVIVAIGREFMKQPSIRPAEAVRIALDILGYTNAADPYGLADRAIMLLAKDAQ
jgi:hypothetical protein